MPNQEPLVGPLVFTVLGTLAAIAIVVLFVFEIRANRKRGREFEERRQPPKRLP